MKYKLLVDQQDKDLITEDGGVVTLHHNGERFISSYYQRRLTDCDPKADSVWDELAEGKMYVKEWRDKDPSEEEFIEDALDWLVMPRPALGFERDDSLFPEFNFRGDTPTNEVLIVIPSDIIDIMQKEGIPKHSYGKVFEEYVDHLLSSYHGDDGGENFQNYFDENVSPEDYI